jgi:small subunit ribosomal protein S3
MGVQITISGKLRGDRSAFEKHTAGVLPRAGHHAEVLVDEDIAHVGTAMGLIGIRIRIARKEKLIPEFEMRKDTSKKIEPDEKTDEKKKTKVEEVIVENVKVEVIKVDGKKDGDKSESEVIELEEKKIEKIETLEEEEAKMK